jgi:hypothetical protein
MRTLYLEGGSSMLMRKVHNYLPNFMVQNPGDHNMTYDPWHLLQTTSLKHESMGEKKSGEWRGRVSCRLLGTSVLSTGAIQKVSSAH